MRKMIDFLERSSLVNVLETNLVRHSLGLSLIGLYFVVEDDKFGLAGEEVIAACQFSDADTSILGEARRIHEVIALTPHRMNGGI